MEDNASLNETREQKTQRLLADLKGAAARRRRRRSRFTAIFLTIGAIITIASVVLSISFQMADYLYLIPVATIFLGIGGIFAILTADANLLYHEIDERRWHSGFPRLPFELSNSKQPRDKRVDSSQEALTN